MTVLITEDSELKIHERVGHIKNSPCQHWQGLIYYTTCLEDIVDVTRLAVTLDTYWAMFFFIGIDNKL